MYSRVSERAFDALLTKFFETIDEKAASSGCRGSMIDGYKNGYVISFFSMELSALDEEAQLRMYNVITERTIKLRRDIRSKDLELTAREVKIA